MKTFCATLISIVCITAAIPISEKKLYLENFKSVAKHKCAVPQPRAFSLNEIIPKHELEESNPAISFSPIATVLHRCENAGCCPRKDEACSPKAKEVTLVFRKLNTASNVNQFVSITALNHTECFCKNINKLPK